MALRKARGCRCRRDSRGKSAGAARGWKPLLLGCGLLLLGRLLLGRLLLDRLLLGRLLLGLLLGRLLLGLLLLLGLAGWRGVSVSRHKQSGDRVRRAGRT